MIKKILLGLVACGFLATSAACDGYHEVSTRQGVVEGECVGFGKRQDPRFTYELDTWNAVWGIAFSPTLGIPLVVWALEYVYCPVAEARASSPGS